MDTEISTFTLPLPFRMGYVNCYLIETCSGFALIDTGSSRNRQELTRALEKAGCQPGRLGLVVLTHGDFDHTGNAAYLRSRYGCKLAMHRDDADMVKRGDMFANRKKPNPIFGLLLPLFTGFGKTERFSPDLLLADGFDLSEYGLEAQVLSLPGHSSGSLGILTSSGDLFCGDLLENSHGPVLNALMDDIDQANESLKRLRGLKISMVYPGHGSPFRMDQILTETFSP